MAAGNGDATQRRVVAGGLVTSLSFVNPLSGNIVSGDTHFHAIVVIFIRRRMLFLVLVTLAALQNGFRGSVGGHARSVYSDIHVEAVVPDAHAFSRDIDDDFIAAAARTCRFARRLRLRKETEEGQLRENLNRRADAESEERQ